MKNGFSCSKILYNQFVVASVMCLFPEGCVVLTFMKFGLAQY